MSKEQPYRFTAPMVRAILEGRKTQDRRIVKDECTIEAASSECVTMLGRKVKKLGPGRIGREAIGFMCAINQGPTLEECIKLFCPYGQPGDRLWVRESLTASGDFMVYAADGGRIDCGELDWPAMIEKRRKIPSIHMPRWASRITLEITGIRVELLQDISRDDAIAEGIESLGFDFSVSPWRNYRKGKRGEMNLHCSDPRRSYMTLWESLHGPGSWDVNPWVWVVEFRRVSA